MVIPVLNLLCLYILFLFFLLYVCSGSLSGKEQTPAIALSGPCSLVYNHQRIQNIKAHGFSYSLGGDWGELYHESAIQLKPTFLSISVFNFA